MIGIDCRRFMQSGIVLFSAAVLVSAPMFAEAKAKAKAKVAKAELAAEDTDKDASKSGDKDAAKGEVKAGADTDADDIFAKDELKDDSDGKSTDEKAAVETANPAEAETEPAANPLATTSAEGAAESETEANTGDEAVEDVEDVEVIAASDEKKGFFPTEFDGPTAVRRDRGLNILTARATRPMALTFVIDHRPYMELAGNEAEDVFFDYLGLDGGNLKIGLGLRFGILEGLDVGIYRLNDGGTVPFDTYEFDVRYAFLNQERFFVDVAVRAGLSWFSQKDADDAVGGYGEIFIDRIFFDMLLIGAGFQFHSDSSSDVKTRDDTPYSGAVLGVIEWRMIKQLALVAEVAASVLGYGSEYGNAKRPSIPGFSMGLKILTHRHTFALMVSNTQFINADGIVSNSWRDFSDILFGFQILREFNFR